MQPVIIYCAAGVRSAQAVAFLKNKGLEDVSDGEVGKSCNIN